jgi:hypothetical protein
MMFCAWAIAAILGQIDGSYVPKTTPFPDVPPGHWAATAVQQLKDEGILVGYPAGTFSPVKVDASPGNVDRVFRQLVMNLGFERAHCRPDQLVSKFEAAVILNGAILNWREKLELLKSGQTSDQPGALRPYWQSRSLLFAWLPELQPELGELGVDTRVLRAMLLECDKATWRYVETEWQSTSR